MFNKLIQLIKHENFHPRLIGIFTNPFYFLRRSLYSALYKNRSVLAGMMLDFGCGRKPYKNLFSVEKYIGVDIQVSGHSHQSSEIDVFYDGKTIPFPDQYFDSFLCSEVFEHLFNLDQILTELHRVTKNNGYGLITIPFCWPEHEQPYDYARYTTFAIKSILEKHRFKVVSQVKSGHFFESCYQMFTLYIFVLFRTNNNFLNLIFTILFISPFNILGIILTWIVPKRLDLFHNQVIVVQKA